MNTKKTVSEVAVVIRLTIDDNTIELTEDQARKLYDKLTELYGQKKESSDGSFEEIRRLMEKNKDRERVVPYPYPQPYPVPYPEPVYPRRYPYYYDVIWSDTTSGFDSMLVVDPSKEL